MYISTYLLAIKWNNLFSKYSNLPIEAWSLLPLAPPTCILLGVDCRENFLENFWTMSGEGDPLKGKGYSQLDSNPGVLEGNINISFHRLNSIHQPLTLPTNFSASIIFTTGVLPFKNPTDTKERKSCSQNYSGVFLRTPTMAPFLVAISFWGVLYPLGVCVCFAHSKSHKRSVEIAQTWLSIVAFGLW